MNHATRELRAMAEARPLPDETLGRGGRRLPEDQCLRGPAVSQAPKEISIVESFIVRAGTNNDRLQSGISRLRDMIDRLVGPEDLQGKNEGATPTPSGILNGLEMQLVANEYFVDMLHQQLRRLNAL